MNHFDLDITNFGARETISKRSLADLKCAMCNTLIEFIYKLTWLFEIFLKGYYQMKHILVTGGAGFIGSHFVRYMLEKYPDYAINMLDKLTYAGNLSNLSDVQECYGPLERYHFFQGDICDPTSVKEAMQGCEYVLNFAAESHVDRSLEHPGHFIMTDVYGTYVLLEQARKEHIERFVQISTDEVYGEILSGNAGEDANVIPRSPYSASKAGGEFIAQAYFVTYGLPVIITRGSNNFGPFQHPRSLFRFS
nr:GDP-mannose 4,6-dehydratase [Dictyobacter kobayashii]